MIVSEFYDLDVGTVKKIHIKKPGWNLKQVT